MKLIDVSVPLDRQLPTYLNNAPFSLEAIKRIASGDSSNVSTLHMSAHGGHVRRRAAALLLRRRRGDRGAAAGDAGCGRGARSSGSPRAPAVDGRRIWSAIEPLGEDLRVLIKTHNSRLVGATLTFHDRLRRRQRKSRREASGLSAASKVVGVDYLSVEPCRHAGRARAPRAAWAPARS